MRARRAAGVALALVTAACARGAAPGADGGTSEAGVATGAAGGASDAGGAPAADRGTASGGAEAREESKGARRAAGPATEARRSSVPRVESDPVLAANKELLKKQFGSVLPASIAMQVTEPTPEGRRAMLVGAERRDGTLEAPMVLVVEDRGALVWSKDRPAAGIKPPLGPMALAAGPHGRFAMAVCDPPTSSVALRLWDEDGAPFADFQALEARSCDALSLLYWPGHGWVIAAAGPTETRAQMVTEAGGLAWGAGRSLGARWRTSAPVTLANDTASSLVLVQYSLSPGVDREVDHAVAFRYAATGEPMWPAPVDLGPMRRILPGQERIPLSRSSEGALRAHVASGTIELRSNGETRRIGR